MRGHFPRQDQNGWNTSRTGEFFRPHLKYPPVSCCCYYCSGSAEWDEYLSVQPRIVELVGVEVNAGNVAGMIHHRAMRAIHDDGDARKLTAVKSRHCRSLPVRLERDVTVQKLLEVNLY